MAENKEYTKHVQEGGNLLISEDVIVSIVSHAISEVEGIVGLVSKHWGKGVKVQILNDTTVIVECNVIVAYGVSIVNTAKAAQAAVISAIDAVTNIKVKAVNVNVCGVVRK